MADVTVRKVDRGFWSRVRDPAELKRGSSADGSQNTLNSRRTIKTPFGIGKVESGSLPLDSGNEVLGMYPYTELDKTQHFLAVTKDTIQKRNQEASEWTDLTQSGQPLQANVLNPVSFATILHTDAAKLNGNGDDWFHHCCVSNGGLTPIQRWAGKYEIEFADLLGGAGYHDAGSGRDTHYARQIISFYNHVCLVNPKIANSADVLKENNQMVLWSATGKMELYSGVSSGNSLFVDTGGYNVWTARLGNLLMVYQNNSIYSLSHIGGRDVFAQRLEMEGLGLLGPHLIHAKRNVHYFVGNDFNLYRYFGGSNLELISKGIDRFFRRDLDTSYQDRCWLQMGADNSRLWLFIVPNGKEFITEAYGIDTVTGSWMKRDYTHKWPTGGISSVGLIGASTFDTGMTYREAIDLGKSYADMVTEGTTYRQMVETNFTKERIVFGDNTGFVYQYDSDLTQDDGVDIPSQHLTEVSDGGKPGKNKLWPSITITAKGTNIEVSYRTTNFETENTGWTSLGITALTSEFLDYLLIINDTSRKIQFKFHHTGDVWQLSNYVINEPQLQGEI